MKHVKISTRVNFTRFHASLMRMKIESFSTINHLSIASLLQLFTPEMLNDLSKHFGPEFVEKLFKRF